MEEEKLKQIFDLFGVFINRIWGVVEEGKKLSIAFCKKFLKDHGKEYTDEEVFKIREVLYIFAELDYLIGAKVPPIQSDDSSSLPP